MRLTRTCYNKDTHGDKTKTLISCESKGILDHDGEMESHVELEGSNDHREPLEGELESYHI